jgi:glycerol-3-phosphate dehydrogenase
MSANSKSEFSARTRWNNLEKIGSDLLDILIVGGGITGAGIARDAAMRGYRVALVDKGDFASGTSSKSSRLVHGGVRYLELFEFGLVYEASRERRTLMQIAPHLVRPLPFLFPVYRDARWKPWMINIGMWLYDALAAFRNVKRHRMLSRAQIKELMPGIDAENISGGALYFDGQVDDARLTLETIRAAHRHGAAIANYVQVDSLIKEAGRIVGVQAHDVLNGQRFSIRSRIVVNATGPWTDTLLQLDNPQSPRRLRPTKGVHILVPKSKMGGDNAVAFPAHSDGRLMFLIPWGDFTIVGTTDTDYDGNYDNVHADKADVDYIVASANHAFAESPIDKSDIISAYAGLRPLVLQLGKSAAQTSREHVIWTSESGLVTIAGGKLTTYRSMAQELVDLVGERLKKEFRVVASRPCETVRTSLVEDGAVPSDGLAGRSTAASDFPNAVINHLIHAHGPEYYQVLELTKRDSRLAQPIVEGLPYLWAEVPYAIEQEMAMTASDILGRRTHILNEAWDNGLAAAPQVAAYIGEFLDWDKSRIDRELRAYQEQVDLASKFK